MSVQVTQKLIIYIAVFTKILIADENDNCEDVIVTEADVTGNHAEPLRTETVLVFN
jgi:hypothetical protein